MTLPRRAWVPHNRLRTSVGRFRSCWGIWPPLRPVSVAWKNKPSTMLSSNVQSIDLPMDCMAWRFWTMKQPNGCSAPAPRSSAAKQWFEQLVQKKEEEAHWKQAIAACKIILQWHGVTLSDDIPALLITESAITNVANLFGRFWVLTFVSGKMFRLTWNKHPQGA